MEPDSAIVNIYEVDDCIPPHIDHHDFSRPFCTISLLSEEAIMFGQKLVPEGPGEFHGINNRHTLIDLPKGQSLLAILHNIKASQVHIGWRKSITH